LRPTRSTLFPYTTLFRSLTGAKQAGASGAAERFYQRGLRLCQDGDPDAARRIWENVIRSFGDVESEQRWVRLSQEALRELAKQGDRKSTRLNSSHLVISY